MHEAQQRFGAGITIGSRNVLRKADHQLVLPVEPVPEFEAALRCLSEGQTTPAPVLSRHGWHIIRLNALAPGQVLPFETVRPRIAEALEKAAWARASRDFVNRLGQKATITGASLAPI